MNTVTSTSKSACAFWRVTHNIYKIENESFLFFSSKNFLKHNSFRIYINNNKPIKEKREGEEQSEYSKRGFIGYQLHALAIFHKNAHIKSKPRHHMYLKEMYSCERKNSSNMGIV